MGTTLQDSQVILIGMSDSRSSEVTQRQLESDLEPEVTTTQQIQHAQDEEEQEIDVVGIDKVENKTPETATGGTEMRNKEAPHPSQPDTDTNTQVPAVVVNHPQEVKDEIDLPWDSADPPQIHQHFKLRVIPLKETKTKMERIQMKK